VDSPSPFLDRLLRAAMKRRWLDTLALHALMKATHLLGLALGERLRQYRDSGDRPLDRFASSRAVLHVHLRAVEIHGPLGQVRAAAAPLRPRCDSGSFASKPARPRRGDRLFRVSTNTVQR
jgi:hypothetical protein